MIDVDADGVVEFTRALVRIPSTNDPGRRERAAAELVAARIREWGWEPAVYEVEPDRPNVIAVVEGGGGDGPTLMFEGHTDVVTEGDLSAWTVDPYGAEIRDGKLWGRGSADMKSGLAATLYATRALQLAGPFPGRIKVCALADEEGLMIGAHHFVSEGLAADVDGAIVAEPEAGEICAVAKGALRLRVDLTSSEPQVNVIPAVASVFVDVRTIPGAEHKEIADRVTTLASYDGIAAEVSVLVDRPPVDVPVSDPVVAALAAAHRAVTGEEPVYGGVPGSTDGTVLTHWGGIPSVVYGPGGKWIAHQADEYVEVEEIVRCTRVFAEAARRFLNGDR